MAPQHLPDPPGPELRNKQRPKPRPTLPDPVTGQTLTTCVVCGYSLEGLAVPRVCPECGQMHSSDLVVLAGVPKRGIKVSVWRRLGWALSILMLFAGMQTLGFVIVFGSYVPVLLVLLGLVGLVALTMTRRGERIGTAWIVFDAQGIMIRPFVRQGVSSDRVVLGEQLAWEPGWSVELKPVSRVWARLRIGVVNAKGRNRGEILEAGVRMPAEVWMVFRDQIAAMAQPAGAESPGLGS